MTTPLALPSPASIPSPPPDAQQRIRVGLLASDAEQALGKAFTGLLVRTTRVAGVLGVSVPAGRDCDFGRRLADGSVEVWYVPKVLSQPGELGCTPEAAPAGLGKTSPTGRGPGSAGLPQLSLEQRAGAVDVRQIKGER
jgi:hypothetical protein